MECGGGEGCCVGRESCCGSTGPGESLVEGEVHLVQGQYREVTDSHVEDSLPTATSSSTQDYD